MGAVTWRVSAAMCLNNSQQQQKQQKLELTGTQLLEAREQQQAVEFSLDHFSKYCIGMDVSESGGSPVNGKPPTAALCQGVGADAFRAMRTWGSQESLLQKYCSGSCQNSRLFQGRSMSSSDAAMYTVLAIRRRLATAAKDPACACSSCKVRAICNPQSPATRNRIRNGNWVSGPQKIIGVWFNMETFTPVARNKISNAKRAGCQWPEEYVESQMHIRNNQAVAQSGDMNSTIEE